MIWLTVQTGQFLCSFSNHHCSLQILLENVSLAVSWSPSDCPLLHSSGPASSAFFWQGVALLSVEHDFREYSAFFQGTHDFSLGFWRTHGRASGPGWCFLFKLWRLCEKTFFSFAGMLFRELGCLWFLCPYQIGSLDPLVYSPRTYYLANTDKLSEQKAKVFYHSEQRCSDLSSFDEGSGGEAWDWWILFG